jgi:hypothetical protein
MYGNPQAAPSSLSDQIGGGIGGGILEAADAQPRETQVGSQIGRQGAALEQLSKLLSRLEKRLSPALRGSVPPAPMDGRTLEGKPALVGVASAISNQNDQIDGLCRQVSDIISRLEL